MVVGTVTVHLEDMVVDLVVEEEEQVVLTILCARVTGTVLSATITIMPLDLSAVNVALKRQMPL